MLAGVPVIGKFRDEGFGAVTRFLVVGPVRLIFLVEGKAVFLQVGLGQDPIVICIGVPKGKGGGRDQFPDRFLGDGMRFQGMIGNPLLNLDDLLGFFPLRTRY